MAETPMNVPISIVRKEHVSDTLVRTKHVVSKNETRNCAED